MKLLDFFFGKKKTFKHSKLGILTSDRIKSNDNTLKHNWSGAIKIKPYNKETHLILEGNMEMPNQLHIECLVEIKENWDTKYLNLVEEKINKNSKLENWKNDFYIGQITPLNDSYSHFELTLEPVNESKTDFIGIEVKNNTITKVEFYS